MSDMNKKEILLSSRLIIVLRKVDSEILPEVVNALYRGGVRAAEIAFDPKDNDEIKNTARDIYKIRELTDGKMVIGAGTCVNCEICRTALSAGAEVIVSPNTDREVIELTKTAGAVSMPGAFTPTECVNAYSYGADIVKLFPFTSDDLGMLKNITVPLNYIPFFCFGGVNETSVTKFFDNGAAGIGTGISVIKRDLLENKDFDSIEKLAFLHTSAISDYFKRG